MFHLFQTKHEGNVLNFLTVVLFVCVFRLVTLLYFGFSGLYLGHTINHYSSLPFLHFVETCQGDAGDRYGGRARREARKRGNIVS